MQTRGSQAMYFWSMMLGHMAFPNTRSASSTLVLKSADNHNEWGMDEGHHMQTYTQAHAFTLRGHGPFPNLIEHPHLCR